MTFVQDKFKRGFSNPIGRWAAVGPYYAMFPLEFAFDVVGKYSKEGELVLDPFAGRASSIFAAATQNKEGIGIEINPVGWVYGKAKLNPAPLLAVEKRLTTLISMSKESCKQFSKLPEFFEMCYSDQVLTFLLTTRDELNWQKDCVDRTLMAFLLIYLHGKLGEGLSNQMRQTKAMGPNYSVRWWQEHGRKPPEIQIEDFLLQRIRWRYAKGLPTVTSESKVELGDSTEILPNLVKKVNCGEQRKCSLLFTSPPYQGITNYHEDQWLRLWLLGGDPKPGYAEKKHKGKFLSKDSYRQLLESVFKSVSKLMSEDGTVYVRTSAREFTFNTTKQILRQYFSSWKEKIIENPFPLKTQTHQFGDTGKKPGEMDIILTTR